MVCFDRDLPPVTKVKCKIVDPDTEEEDSALNVSGDHVSDAGSSSCYSVASSRRHVVSLPPNYLELMRCAPTRLRATMTSTCTGNQIRGSARVGLHQGVTTTTTTTPAPDESAKRGAIK